MNEANEKPEPVTTEEVYEAVMKFSDEERTKLTNLLEQSMNSFVAVRFIDAVFSAI